MMRRLFAFGVLVSLLSSPGVFAETREEVLAHLANHPGLYTEDAKELITRAMSQYGHADTSSLLSMMIADPQFSVENPLAQATTPGVFKENFSPAARNLIISRKGFTPLVPFRKHFQRQDGFLQKLEARANGTPISAADIFCALCYEEPTVKTLIEEYVNKDRSGQFRPADQLVTLDKLKQASGRPVEAPGAELQQETAKAKGPYRTRIDYSVPGNKNNYALQGWFTNFNQDVHIGKEEGVISTELFEFMVPRLSNQTLKNMFLIGPPGVGKTYSMYGLICAINQKDPRFTDLTHLFFKDKEIISFEYSSFMAGAQNAAEISGRIKVFLEFLRLNKERVIVFVDEAHTLIGEEGKDSGRSLIIEELKKAIITEDYPPFIFATTEDEHRMYFAKNEAFESRCPPYVMQPMDKYTAIKVIKRYAERYSESLKKMYKQKYKMNVRFVIPERMIRMLVDLVVEFETRFKLPRPAKGAFEEAISVAISKTRGDGTNQELVVTLQEEHIFQAVANTTRTPITLIEGRARLAEILESSLKKEVVGVGKEAMIDEIVSFYRRARPREGRPLGVFLTVGSADTGKTLTAQLIAKALDPSQEAYEVVDLSRFKADSSVSNWRGSDAGLVGSDKTTMFTRIREKKRSVIVFKNFSQTNSQVQGDIIRIITEGKFVIPANEAVVDFSKVTLIFEENTEELLKEVMARVLTEKKADEMANTDIPEEVKKEAIRKFPSEISGNFDLILRFNDLSEQETRQIIDNKIKQALDCLMKDHPNIKQIELEKEVFDLVAQELNRRGLSIRGAEKTIESLVGKEIEDFMYGNSYADTDEFRFRLKVRDCRVLLEQIAGGSR